MPELLKQAIEKELQSIFYLLKDEINGKDKIFLAELLLKIAKSKIEVPYEVLEELCPRLCKNLSKIGMVQI